MTTWKRGTSPWLVALLLAAALLPACAQLPRSPGGATEAEQQAQEQQKREREKQAQEQLAQQKLAQETLERDHRALQTRHQKLGQDYEKLGRERQKLEEVLKKHTASQQDLEDRLARLQLALFEKDAQIKLLTQKLDAAILEVVRTLAKLRSLESRAEAASNLAETEIALRLAERDSAGRPKAPDTIQAEQLLAVAGQEFKKENYGGALYLTTQAKSLLKSGPGRTPGDSLPKVEGEVLFSLPLALRVRGGGRAHDGPGQSFKVAFPVPEGMPVTGHSYKGMWVRVKADDGRSGWIYYNLVGQR
ncbi:MAG: hypothetical protein ACREMB_09210 [Candidatus Rokuibacteriota bacterium]